MRLRLFRHVAMGKPGRLPFGVLAGGDDGAAGCLAQRDLAAQTGREFGHAVGPHGGQRWVQAGGDEGAHFVERADLQHGIEAAGDGGAQGGTRRVKQDRVQVPGGGFGMCCGVPGGKAASGAAPYFPGTGEALAVGGAQGGGGVRVGVGQARVQGGGADGCQQVARFQAGLGAGIGQVGQPLGDRREIEAGAAAQDRQAPLRVGRLHGGQSLRAPPGQVAGLSGGADAVERVRDERFVGRGGARGEHTQLGVDLHGISVDDGAAEALGEVEGECRLAAAGRTGHDERAPGRVRTCRWRTHFAWPIGRAPAGSPLMSYVLTLVAQREATRLTQGAIDRVRDAVGGGRTPRILSPDEAADIGGVASDDLAPARAALEGAPVDVLVSRERGRRRQLLVADMDSTIVTSETLDELAAYAGLKESVSAITRRSMNGEIDFREALRERVGLLRGLKLDALEATWRSVELTPGAESLVATMRWFGARTALVSGGFTFFTSRVAALCGFDHHRANVLLDDGVALTGEVGEPILDRDAKLATMRQLARAAGLRRGATLAVGDGANDLAMLREAGLGVAFRAKPVVAAEVGNRVDFADLRALLFVQGYPATAFR